MTCEKCGAEMIEGIYRCPKCGHFIADPYADDTDIFIEEEIPESLKNPTLQAVTKNCSQTNYEKILKPIIKILIVIIILCAVALCVIFGLKKAQSKKSDTPSDSIISDEVATTVPTVNGEINQVQQQITEEKLQNVQNDTPEYKAYSCSSFTALISGNFYLDCDIDEGAGATQNFKMAYSGDNMEITCDADGMTLTIMQINGKNYFVDLNSKTYINLSQAIMNLMGVEESDLELNTGLPDQNTLFTFDTKIENGIEYVTATYADTTGLKSTLFINGNTVTKIESYDTKGNVSGTIIVNELTGVIPSNLLTTDGYKATTMMNFVTKIMEQQEAS